MDFGRDEYLYVKALPQEATEINLSISDPLASLGEVVGTSKLIYPSKDYRRVEEKLDFPAFDRNMILLGEFVVRGRRMVQEREKFMGELVEKAKVDFNNDFVCNIGGLLNCPYCRITDKKPIEGKIYLVFQGDAQAFDHKVIKAGLGYTWTHITYKYPVYTDE